MNNPLLIIIVLGITIGISVFFLGQPRIAQHTSTIKVQEFAEFAKDPTYTLIDIRTTEEYQQDHIVNVRNIDFYQTDLFVSELDKLDKSHKYLIYCRTGNRSAKALTQMKNMGFTNVSDLQGGIVAWQQAGLPLTK